MSRILGLWSGHDSSFCVLTDGVPTLHTEAERHTRIKESPYDSIRLFFEHDGDTKDVIALATCHSANGIKKHVESWEKIKGVAPLEVTGHHQAHAAHAFYSSNFDEAISITLDGGGIEDGNGFCVGASVWFGKDTQLTLQKYYPLEQVNIGGVWSRITRHVFKYESGAPFGSQVGTTMALAALADDSSPFVQRFRDMFSKDLQQATARAPGHVNGMSAKDPLNPRHPYLDDLAQIGEKNEQAKFDMAGALQQVTEERIMFILRHALHAFPGVTNICFSGGVALNSVAMGKLVAAFPSYSFYIPPVPYDAGLTIGAAQYVWHHTLGNSRVAWNDCVLPYMGPKYSVDDVDTLLEEHKKDGKITTKVAVDEDVIELLTKGNIVSVFHDRAESGRRALGNRSILADPRSPEMKDKVNEKVKHRQAFRPFAPSVIREHVKEWFDVEADSPYMGFVLKFKDNKKDLVPAVVHFDGTARLQTVTEKINPWYHGFITLFYEKTGVPMLLNTSFNDREPICETPAHALRCFLGTEIDYLYFADFGWLVSKA